MSGAKSNAISGAMARVKSGVSYVEGGASATAPAGDYVLSADADAGAMRLAPLAGPQAGSGEFRLSLDAFCRFVGEGRITLLARAVAP